MGSRKVSLADKLKKVDELHLQAEKKGQGVDAFFASTIDRENVEKDEKAIDVDTYTLTDTSTDTDTVTKTGTDTDTGTDSMLNTLLSNSEQLVRCVAYLRKEQSDFVKDLSKQLTKKNKGKRIKESEIFRMAMDMLMDAVKK